MACARNPWTKRKFSDKGIYDKEEFKKALAWARENCKEGFDKNPADVAFSKEEKDAQWEFVVKAMLIVRDLMIGNPVLKDMGFAEEACGHNAIVAGIQGQRQWTDYKPNFDFLEAMMCSQFDWNGLREAFVVATENDTLNGMTMLIEHLLTDTPGIFADVRTYWSPDAVERVTGKKLSGLAENGVIHLINSGAASLDGTGAVDGEDGPVIKPFYDMTGDDAKKCLDATEWCPADVFYFRGGGFSSHYKKGTRGGMPVTMARLNLVKGLGPVQGGSSMSTAISSRRSTNAPTRRGRRHGSPRSLRAKARSRTCIPSWRTGARTMARSAAAISARS